MTNLRIKIALITGIHLGRENFKNFVFLEDFIKNVENPRRM